ncbi:hypothetical protein QAD02_017421 [Eretmocerus hayati]|uniref:Uncharacterized protein n=1 Tax=Eretmocerus hayati TaxID=131215 RepID=A0ACC2PE83_9HYME|nr:hypothetical protein QAD02_017421 [Eretmocerus hayati]
MSSRAAISDAHYTEVPRHQGIAVPWSPQLGAIEAPNKPASSLNHFHALDSQASDAALKFHDARHSCCCCCRDRTERAENLATESLYHKALDVTRSIEPHALRARFARMPASNAW